MTRVALLTVSDGRPEVYASIEERCRSSSRRVTAALASRGHQVVAAPAPIGSTADIEAFGRGLAADVLLVHFPVWAFPHFTVLAERTLRLPTVLFCELDPRYPGMVGMLAAAGALEQVGVPFLRTWGAIDDPAVLDELDEAVAAAAVVSALRGTTFGRVGGRPMGMYTAVADPARWMASFGVDVEEIDQYELVRRADLAPADELRGGREWLERSCAAVYYDGARLTPELLERQLALYLAMQELIDEHGLAFSGVKAQPELTDHVATLDVAEALLNDPYDWRGPKLPHACATEADMDGALTMRILQLLTGMPVLFSDVRHYDPEADVWDLCNSGQHATWFAARADDAADNLRHVQLFPSEIYFPAGGASVHHLAAPGSFTFARLTCPAGRYRLQVVAGEMVTFDAATNERLMSASTPTWPHALARLAVPPEAVLSRFGSNHIHGVPGDRRRALQRVCELLDVDYEPLGDGS